MALIKCPECGQTVLSVATQCPQCSYRLAPESGGIEPNELRQCPHCNELFTRRAKRWPQCGEAQRRKGPIVVAGVVGVVLLGAAGFAVSGLGNDAQPTATIVRAPPPSLPAVEAPVPRPVDSAAVVDPVPPTSPPAVVTTTRFARDWANVRADRTLQGTIIAILRPGQEVAVADRRGGWWSVYLVDSLVGYVSANLLDSLPPLPGGGDELRF